MPVVGSTAPGTISHEPQVERSLQWPWGMVGAIVGARVGARVGERLGGATRKQSAGFVAEGGTSPPGFHITLSLL